MLGAYSAFAGARSSLADLPEGKAGGRSSEAEHEGEKRFRGHVNDALYFLTNPGRSCA
ncbi:hypothetical protein SynRS9909_02108 [Synechococcus sp. RS9909]|nr:hypothetical protein SynRS9909_02108 [Synechococcus sp. RS9909]